MILIMLTATAGAQPVLLPEPRHMETGKGSLPLSQLKVVIPPTAGKAEAFALLQLKEFTGPGGQIPFSYVLDGKGHKEYYQLSVKPSGVRVVAHTPAGLFYAVQTLRQLGPISPVVEIEDQPAIAYRGVMMDFAHGALLTVEEIKRQIDFLARWKVNQYYFYNEVSMELKGYESLNIGAAYTQQQIKEMNAGQRAPDGRYYGQPGSYNQYNQQAAAPMESQMGCGAPGPHQVAITDEYGFKYDSCGDLLNGRDNVMSPHTR